jgi:hypothetical protein
LQLQLLDLSYLTLLFCSPVLAYAVVRTQALFRPVTMVVPDLEQICEIMLFSEGFDSAKLLAKKMTVLYNLSKEQLSKQHHYDFGASLFGKKGWV